MTKFSVSLIVSIVLCASATALAQTVAVTPKKIVHRRTNPQGVEKRTFSITHPRISGVKRTVKMKLESALDYEKVFGFTVKEEQTESQWLSSATYKVDLNKGGVLSVTLTLSGSGAYPSDSVRQINLNSVSGEQIGIAAELLPDAGPRLLEKLNGMLENEIARYRKRMKDPRYAGENPSELVEIQRNLTPENLENFSVGERGITFIYDYEFPHAIKALEPPGRFFLPWSKLKPYIKSSGAFKTLMKR